MFTGNAHRSASLNLRVPSHSPDKVIEDNARVTTMVSNLADRHGLTPRPMRPLFGGSLFVGVPGYTGGQWPGQPDVD